MKKLLKKLLPKWVMSLYYFSIAWIAALRYGFPARKMIVIGVTGTKGKTSTSNFIWACLRAGGHKTGIISTANIRVGDEESLNAYHMTMPGRFPMQRLMAQMAREGCTHCVIETTSEGLKQFRHIGVYYDIGVFTNLTPEHLPSHEGSFEKYKAEKEKMFAYLARHPKKLHGRRVEKVIIANADSPHMDVFLRYPADKKITYAIEHDAMYRATDIATTPNGVTFSVGSDAYTLTILGKFNVYNALPAIVIARLAGDAPTTIARGLRDLAMIPGRMEGITEGQDFTVIVDYAHEKESMTNVLQTARAMRPEGARTIVLLGAEGGGRDKAKRPIMGRLAAELADFVIVSNVDPYEDDPTEIVEDIARASEQYGKVRHTDLFVIEDRREGIRKAFALARAGDVVLLTGKGAEQSMEIGGKKIPWDDRVVAREELGRKHGE